MRLMSRLVLTVGLAIAFQSAASAQRPGGGGGFGFGGGGATGGAYSRVAESKMLAEELNLSDEQKEKIKDALKPIEEKRRDLFPRGAGGGGGQRPSEEQMREIREKMTAISSETTKAVESVLKPEQIKRLKEINIQIMGINAFASKDVAEGLKLTEGQAEKVKAIVEGYTKDVSELRRGMFQRGAGGGDREEIQKRMAEMTKKTSSLTKDAMEKIEELLKDEQKSAWSDMIGKKFDTAKFQAEAMASFRPMRRDN